MSETVKVQDNIKLPSGDKLVLSSSPHLSSGSSLCKIMGGVLLALLPQIIASTWIFGFRALFIIIYTALCCVGAEALWCKLAGKDVWRNISDCSAIVTGVLLAMCLPVAIPLYVPPIGAILAIWLAKQIYGGIGNNPFNPALVARVGLLIALPAAMTLWTPSRGMKSADYPALERFYDAAAIEKINSGSELDAVSCATPLGVANTTRKITGKSDSARNNFAQIDSKALLKRYLLGDRAGCIGETCVPALLLGFIILVALNLINWSVPILFIATVVLLTGIINFFFPGVTPGPLFHLCTGGLLLGAIFMATDMVTSPITGLGCAIFAIGCGLLTTVIRIWGNYPEGVSFAILFMNALVPLIDRHFGEHPFGYVPKRQ